MKHPETPSRLDTLSKTTSFLIVTIAYILAILGVRSILTFVLAHTQNMLMAALYADIAGTIIVFFFSFNLKNSSVFDLYWGAIPPFLIYFWNQYSGSAYSVKNDIIMISYFLFCARQLFFYLRSWPGLSYEEFRFQEWKEKIKNPILYWLFSLVSIHFFSMGMVFLSIIPIYHCLRETTVENVYVLYLGILIANAGWVIEAIGDQQLYQYRKRGDKGIIQEGLWKYSRHPNYFGEITHWWGWYIAALGVSSTYWKDFVGALVITLVFLTYSIPSMEKKLSKRNGYAQIQASISMLVPWYPRSSKSEKKDN